MSLTKCCKFIFLLLLLPILAAAALPPVEARVRYMAVGDSLAAGLLVVRFEEKGFENTFEVPPTNRGHQVIEEAFRAVVVH